MGEKDFIELECRRLGVTAPFVAVPRYLFTRDRAKLPPNVLHIFRVYHHYQAIGSSPEARDHGAGSTTRGVTAFGSTRRRGSMAHRWTRHLERLIAGRRLFRPKVPAVRRKRCDAQPARELIQKRDV